MCEIIKIGEGSAASALSNASCAFGVFDGVHLGHQYLIAQAIRTAGEVNGGSVALTFSIDPDEMFAADRLTKLMSNEERLDALASSGVDAVVVLDFDAKFAALSPNEFLEHTFGANTPAYLHVGEGFRFGCRGSGDVGLLEDWGKENGMSVCCHNLLQAEGRPISSTRIRRLLSQERWSEADRLLGRPSDWHHVRDGALVACCV